jgi:ammonia channel protein AmtB
VATIVFVFVTSFVVFKVIGITLKNRVPAESEFEGLDVSEMGTIAYPDFSVAASRHDPTSLFPPSGR